MSHTWLSPLESRERGVLAMYVFHKRKGSSSLMIQRKILWIPASRVAEGWNDTLGGRVGCTGAVHSLALVPLAACGFRWLWPGWISPQLLSIFTTSSSTGENNQGVNHNTGFAASGYFQMCLAENKPSGHCVGGAWWESTSG